MGAAELIASANKLSSIPLPTSPDAVQAILAEAQRRRSAPKPQPGPQTQFMESEADIAIYGGAAGAGKTYALLMVPLAHINNSRYAAVIFRRETPQIRNPGGLWDESCDMYRPMGATALSSPLEQRFPSGAIVKFSHLEREDDVQSWDGAQVPLIGFDQLEHFTRRQFFYMLSRNRSACGVRPCVKATCNPNADSWLAEFIAWWIDQTSGFPIKERSGVLRWMVRDGDTIKWYDSKQEAFDANRVEGLPDDHPEQPLPLSVTFIPGNVYDNQKLLEVNPQYLANLKALNVVERGRLLGGNWKIRPAAGMMFRREWCETVDVLPADCDFVRYWDRAATEKTQSNDPDLTCGIKLAKQRSTGLYFLVHAVWGWYSPGKGDEIIRNTASADGAYCRVGHPQDPGQAGKQQAQEFVRKMDGYAATTERESGDKVTRFMPFSAQCEAGNVKILRGFDEEVLRRLENFPDGRYKDDADACSGAYDMFNNAKGQGMRDWARQQAEVIVAEQQRPSQGGSAFMRAAA